MSEIVFSTMSGTHKALELARFEAIDRHQVRIKPITWENAWDELFSYGLHNRGPDISQVGTTWLGSLVNMQALTPFSQREIEFIGGSNIFTPTAWETSIPPGEVQVFGIPWIADTNVIVYRRDALASAGVDEANAFASHVNLVKTLTRLKAYGHPCPLAIPTTEEVIHNIAPWVWAQGGTFRSPDRRHLTLTTPKTLAGVQQFYELHQFIAPIAQSLNTAAVNELFFHGEAAVILTVQSLLPHMVYQEPPAFGLKNVGSASAPGIPFIGGSGLVIWQHAFQRELALQVIRFLCSYEVQNCLLERTNQIPVRRDVLGSTLFTQHPLFNALSNSLIKGRAFQSSYQWGTIEARLFPVFNQLWQELFTNPAMNLQTELHLRLSEISARLEKNILSFP